MENLFWDLIKNMRNVFSVILLSDSEYMTGTDLHFSVLEMRDRKNDCPFKPTRFNRMLSHVWNKHSIEKNFSYKCGISV